MRAGLIIAGIILLIAGIVVGGLLLVGGIANKR